MLDKAEQPEKMIRLIIQEMEETLVEVRATAAKNIADKKTLLRQIRSLESNIADWQAKAELAVNKERDDLAKSAIAEKNKNMEQVLVLRQELDLLEECLTNIQQDSQSLQDKLSEAKRRQQAYVVRQQSVEVRLKVRQKAAVVNIDEAIAKFERYQQKIDRVEAEIEAYDLTENKDLHSQFRALENDDSIAQELAEMKKKVANG